MRKVAESKGMGKFLSPVDFVVLYVEDKNQRQTVGFRRHISRACSKKHITVDKNRQKVAHEDNELKAVHTYSKEEVRGFSTWINSQLSSHPKVNSTKERIPLNVEDANDFFTKLNDGVSLCLMLQKVSENLIDDRAINFKISHPIHMHENLNLAINTAAAIGCVTTGQHPT
jgi:hypothetical protein